MPESYCFNEIKALKKGENVNYAHDILIKLAAIVKPIMTKRGWFVNKLSEFYPKDRYLLGLNINKTAEIKIRLRKPTNYNSFIIFEDLLGTLLHELVHIIRAPHDDEFNRILLSLKKEMAKLILKGYRGDGFYSTGKKLSCSTGLPLRSLRISDILNYNQNSFKKNTRLLNTKFDANKVREKMAVAAEARYFSNKLKANEESNANLQNSKTDIRLNMLRSAEARFIKNKLPIKIISTGNLDNCSQTPACNLNRADPRYLPNNVNIVSKSTDKKSTLLKQPSNIYKSADKKYTLLKQPSNIYKSADANCFNKNIINNNTNPNVKSSKIVIDLIDADFKHIDSNSSKLCSVKKNSGSLEKGIMMD
ncbi:hypothetical protein BB561_004021 [Smittium simulii]|uniref:WLM domain-containing protein n=1 Tax=Smittium simulii TaxID=133385 RepID=A0A2T9YIE3_9FUNG|nr:hypothetical protein BB561_004021 [Smittium simulii]